MPKVSNCPTCKKEFGLFRWRKNCTHCNNIFCDDCLKKTGKLQLCKQCNTQYEKKRAQEKAKYEKKRTQEKAKYEKNLKNWVNGTKQEYLKNYTIIEELGFIQVESKSYKSPNDVEIAIKHQALLLNANAYIKFFWDKKIEHHSEEYIAGHGKKGNPYYKTRNYTTQHFTGHATAVIIKKNTKQKENIDDNGYKYVIECSQALEKYIEKNLNGKGKGLHEKITSIEDELSKKDIENFRFIATARNQIIHEGKMKDSPNKFKEICQKLKLKYNLR